MSATESIAARRALRVLPTINADGTRERVRPRRAPGRFARRRRAVGLALIAVFLILPYVHVGGRPAMLIDLGARELSLFGAVFRPSDTVSLMMLGLAIAFTVVLVTALWGRVWCGWACPQTVWMEWLFRPIERLFEGSPAQQRAIDARGGRSLRRLGKNLVFLAIAFVLAHTFLAYFIGAARVAGWVQGSPADHPVGFAVVAITTGLVFFDFAFFREQTCTFACPYGRLQSVLLDRESLIVAYDVRRGEPRGKIGALRRQGRGRPEVRRTEPSGPCDARPRGAGVAPPEADAGSTGGDCVDCSACVQVCPTGIDIRRGLQMECIGCAQCIDACDDVMGKVDRPRGLIRYTSRALLAGEPRRVLRVRTVVYPLLLTAALVGLIATLGDRAAAEVWIEKTATPYETLASGQVSTPVELRVENRAGAARRYTITLDDPAHAQVAGLQASYPLSAGQTLHVPFFVLSPRTAFTAGRRDTRLVVRDDAGWSTTLPLLLLGPEGGAR